MGSRTATWLAWVMCLVALAAMAGILAIGVAKSSLDAFSFLGIPAILAFSVAGALVASRLPPPGQPDRMDPLRRRPDLRAR